MTAGHRTFYGTSHEFPTSYSGERKTHSLINTTLLQIFYYNNIL